MKMIPVETKRLPGYTHQVYHYIANDGRVFYSELQCKYYEKNKKYWEETYISLVSVAPMIYNLNTLKNKLELLKNSDYKWKSSSKNWMDYISNLAGLESAIKKLSKIY